MSKMKKQALYQMTSLNDIIQKRLPNQLINIVLLIISIGVSSDSLAKTQDNPRYFIVANQMPKDKACKYASPTKTLTLFYPGGPIAGTSIDYNTSSAPIEVPGNTGMPANKLGFQENTGILCPDIQKLFPDYKPCQPNSFSQGRDNSCLNVTVDESCQVTTDTYCTFPKFQLQTGISIDGSYRYTVTGAPAGKTNQGHTICKLTISWLEDWNNPENSSKLGIHACNYSN